MHTVIISRQLNDNLKGENLSYNLGYRETNIRERIPNSVFIYFVNVSCFE
jgi:hypothetical protein